MAQGCFWKNSATVTMHLWETLTANLCCLARLAILVSSALVLLSRIGYTGWVYWFSIRDALKYVGVAGMECHQSWRFVRRHFQLNDTFPMIPNWPWAWPCWKCTESYNFSVSVKEMGERWTGGASDIGARGKRRGLSPGATARNKGRTRVPTDLYILFFLSLISASSFSLCFFHRFWDPTSPRFEIRLPFLVPSQIEKTSDLKNCGKRCPIAAEG